MALVGRVLSSVSKRVLRPHFIAIPSNAHRLFCDKQSNPDSLLMNLLQQPKSSIKPTLDKENCSLRSSDFSWDLLVTSLKYSSPDKALLVLEWMLEKMLKENERDVGLYSELISLCGKLRNFPLAMHVFTSMEANGVKLTSLVFNSLINACWSSNNIRTAFSLFEIMDSSESYKPNFDTYNIFISAFSNSGNIDAMFTWYSAKKAAGFPPDLKTFEYVISGCVKSGSFNAADRIYEEMMESGIVPSNFILENMLEGLCRQKSLGQVVEFFKFLLDGGWEINENMIEKVIGLYLELGKVEEIEELLETSIKSNQDASVLSRIHCGIIRMYAMLDRLDDVEYAVGRMMTEGLSFICADDVERVICSYFRRAAYDRLDLFLGHIKGCYTLTRSTYDLLISGYRRASLLEKVDLLMKDMKLAGFSKLPA
ncbi:Pentatricopeptide repeat [Quillaja saponaria]|uniref:Pentatricopeptide repeat n=1 Tax=Quillaja saponaria TaxID=32244 RepID=A0AAD7LX74_QUISA|nr:Pentatricopeptide repeat [Quillaja saponaria]